MKKVLIIIFVLVLNNCSGYKPIFSVKGFDYHISEIINVNNDNVSRQIIKSLVPFQKDNGKRKVKLEIKSETSEKVVTRDAKGDPLVYEIDIFVELKIIDDSNEIVSRYNENFNFNNKSNKFELSQYKNNFKKNLTERIFQKILLDLQSI